MQSAAAAAVRCIKQLMDRRHDRVGVSNRRRQNSVTSLPARPAWHGRQQNSAQ